MVTELLSMLSSVLFWVLFIICTAIPYGMYLFAYLFESRRPGDGPNDVPFWKDQSRAFLPGDIGLALFLAIGMYYYHTVTIWWAHRVWWFLLCAVIGVGIFWFARATLYTDKHYTPRAWRSPSKWYHDLIMFWLYATVALQLCVPVYFATAWTQDTLGKLLGIFGLSVWVLGNIYDATHHEVPNRRQHPDSYEPIWRSRKRRQEPVPTR